MYDFIRGLLVSMYVSYLGRLLKMYLVRFYLENIGFEFIGWV